MRLKKKKDNLVVGEKGKWLVSKTVLFCISIVLRCVSGSKTFYTDLWDCLEDRYTYNQNFSIIAVFFTFSVVSHLCSSGM